MGGPCGRPARKDIYQQKCSAISYTVRIRRTFLCYMKLIPPGGHKALPYVSDPGFAISRIFATAPYDRNSNFRLISKPIFSNSS